MRNIERTPTRVVKSRGLCPLGIAPVEPHDWSIEDIPSDAGALDVLWTEGTTPARTGPFDFYESEGQTATGWTVGGVGWYRKTFPKLHALSPGAKVELRFEGVY